MSTSPRSALDKDELGGTGGTNAVDGSLYDSEYLGGIDPVGLVDSVEDDMAVGLEDGSEVGPDFI
jgi:hypothetical protein